MFNRIKSLAFSRKNIPTLAILVCVTIALGGCDLTKNNLKIDRAANMETQDFRDALAPRDLQRDGEAQKNSGIPKLQNYVAAPDEDLKPMPLVSVSVNQTVPLRDVLFELAKQADYDIELDPRISGSIIFTARNKPFDVVIKRIADIANLRYKIEDGSLRVEVDTPYQKLYKVDYLSYVRKNSGSISNNVAVVSGDGADTGSKYQATSNSDIDFWGELQTNLDQILGLSRRAATMVTNGTPEIKSVANNPPSVTPVIAETDGQDGGAPNVTVQAPTPQLQVNSLPTTTNAPSTSGQKGDDDSDPNKIQANFSVNKQAGLISVFATARQHKQVAEYLKRLKRSVTSQVLVEAKILEVDLSDEFSTGIDWTAVLNNKFSFGLDVQNASQLRPALTPATSPDTNFNIAYLGGDFQAFAQMIARFGTVRALASPRLTVMNNQSAVLNVANNQVYFDMDVNVTQATVNTAAQTEVSSNIRNVPEGVLINVQPSINLDDQTISMAIRPTVTKITSYVEDPSVAFAVANNNITGVTSSIPVVNVQEMDSVVKMRSGQAIVMGGLMQDSTDSSQNAVPVLGEIPLLGGMFRSQNDKVKKTELVIFLKTTIIKNDDNIDNTDKDLYKTFSGDRRPWKI